MKILVVEDSDRLRRSLSAGLRNLGFVVDTAEDGIQGLAYAKTYAYDLIVLDIMLPGMDGMTVLKHLKDQRCLAHIIMLTAKSDVSDRVLGLNAGADDYLCKPFSFAELEARIYAIKRRNIEIKSANLVLHNLSIDTQLKTVLHADVEIALTPKEYELLELLARNLGRVITYQMIEDKLYESDRIVTKNAIEVLVSTLRKTLKSHGVESVVKTRRSYGYYIDR